MDDFVYQQRARRLYFGAGVRRRAGELLEAEGLRRAFLIVDDAAGLSGIASDLGVRPAATWTEVRQHVPGELAEAARAAAGAAGADCVVCVGGGSATGLAKAIALTAQIPILAVPTTYAGSEQTTIYGITGDRHKRTGRDAVVLPRIVLYDPELTLALPAAVTGASAFNALAHCVNGLHTQGANPITSAIAIEGIRAIAEVLPVVMASPADLDARARMQYGAALAGMVLGDTSTGLHHKICHVLGGTFDLVHADSHSVVLPHSTAFDAPTYLGATSALARALDTRPDDVGGALWDLAKRSGVPTSLAGLGLDRAHLHEVAHRVAVESGNSPQPVAEGALLGLLQRAFDGTRPTPQTNEGGHT